MKISCDDKKKKSKDAIQDIIDKVNNWKCVNGGYYGVDSISAMNGTRATHMAYRSSISIPYKSSGYSTGSYKTVECVIICFIYPPTYTQVRRIVLEALDDIMREHDFVLAEVNFNNNTMIFIHGC